jgi:hypothetical protein
MNIYFVMSYILKKHMMPIHVGSLQRRLKRRKIKDGRYNKHYNKRHEKSSSHDNTMNSLIKEKNRQ